MSAFSEPLIIEYLGNRTYRLVYPFKYYFDNNDVIEAPTGFITDFASIPRPFWPILPPDGAYGKAAVIHDALYQTDGFGGKFTRKQSDDIFLDGMEILGVSWLTRHTMYRAVRMYSWRYWNKSRSQKLAELGRKAGASYMAANTLPAMVPLEERTERIIKTLDPKCRNAFTKFSLDANGVAADFGCRYIAISGHRTWAEQDALYAIGRTRPGRKVTNAKGGFSNHNFAIAADYGVFHQGKYLDDKNPQLAEKVHDKVAQDCEDYGLDWGGNWQTFEDKPHYERHTGLTMAQKRALWKQNNSVL